MLKLCWYYESAKSFFKSKKGQGMVEYGLILALIAVVVIAALTPLGTAVKNLFDGLATPLKPPATPTT